jgi:hypothetical protein
MTPSPRELSDKERSIVERLLQGAFPGAIELRRQLENARVRTIDENGSLEFVDVSGDRAAVDRRVPTEAEAIDRDGVGIHILLHVVGGKLHELEIYKEDGSPLSEPISVDVVRCVE